MTHARLASLLLSLILVAAPAFAEDGDPCPCVPTTPLWTVHTCDSWTCAIALLVSANGNPLVFAIPLGGDSPQWIVFTQVVAGSYDDDGTDPHVVEQFDAFDGAMSRYTAITSDHLPLIFTAPDGRFLVASLRETGGQSTSPTSKRRSTGH
jgi:hypothetical protein